jgi:1-acyl-sn-glycerol-3-phosphate acyltransferase
MLPTLCRFIFKLSGWKVDKNLPQDIKKCIIIAAPHTSNWDFWYTMAAFQIYGIKIRFTVKKEWMKFPFNLIMKPLGGIGIDRSPRMDGNRPSFVDAMTALFFQNQELIIVITPEGTRSKRDKWKTGFFHVAKQANVPICLGYVDYKTKTAGIGKTIPATEIKETMHSIMDFYSTITPKFPANFALDTSTQD